MWQYCVEIEGYSVVYFDRIAMFEAPYRWTSVKDGGHMCFVDAWISNKSTKCIWAPPLTEVQRYGTLNTANMRQNNLPFLHGTATHTKSLQTHHLSNLLLWQWVVTTLQKLSAINTEVLFSNLSIFSQSHPTYSDMQTVNCKMALIQATSRVEHE